MRGPVAVAVRLTNQPWVISRERATVNGAKVMGLEARTGRIAPGMLADLVLVVSDAGPGTPSISKKPGAPSRPPKRPRAG